MSSPEKNQPVEDNKRRHSLKLGKIFRPHHKKSDDKKRHSKSEKKEEHTDNVEVAVEDVGTAVPIQILSTDSSQINSTSPHQQDNNKLKLEPNDQHSNLNPNNGQHQHRHTKRYLSETSSIGSIESTTSMASTHWQDLKGHLHDKATINRLKRELRISLDSLGFNKSPTNNTELIVMLFNRHLHCTLGKALRTASQHDMYLALAHAVHDLHMAPWIRTQDRYWQEDPKRVYYLSMEFLVGRTLSNAIINLDLLHSTHSALHDIGLSLEELETQEMDAGLGNGGLGRLASCFLDSMATLGIAGYGYGLRYEYGIFAQRIENGWQAEVPDAWLARGNPWEIQRPEYAVKIRFYGHTTCRDGQYGWEGGDEILAIPYDTPIPGYKSRVVNTMRLWSAGSTQTFNLEKFSRGDYMQAIVDRNVAENITRVLYPNDSVFEGKELRLKQEYLLVSATIQDILRRFKGYRCQDCSEGLMKDDTSPVRRNWDNFPEKAAIQLNDTHPSLAVPELMRILMDEEHLTWNHAWQICQKVFAYTNHTVLPEALEKWPVDLISTVLPRHIQIIFEINRRFLEEVSERWPGDHDRMRRMSIVHEGDLKVINMAKLSIVASHTVNGVAFLHSELLKSDLFKDFYEMWPHKFQNKTNGVTPRRWIKLCNPTLSKVLTTIIGKGWVVDLSKLKKLESHLNDKFLRRALLDSKKTNKARLATWIMDNMGFRVNTDSLFDVQIKRMHEYKRQLLNCLHLITLFNRIKKNPKSVTVPRTVIFGGKAAPAYHKAKLIIKLINNIATVVNSDHDVSGLLKVVFIPDYRVSMAEIIIPAADLSEQISVAGTEASGTGNMKMMLNGALTIGTMDGANVEIFEAVGNENMFVFGLDLEGVTKLNQDGYNPRSYYENDEELREAIDCLASDTFTLENEHGVFQELVDHLLNDDTYRLMADYRSYIDVQKKVEEAYANSDKWMDMVITNIANGGHFSSDRTIAQYNEEIWHADASIPADPSHVLADNSSKSASVSHMSSASEFV